MTEDRFTNNRHHAPVDNRMMPSLKEGFNQGKSEESKKYFQAEKPRARYVDEADVSDLITLPGREESSYLMESTFTVVGRMTEKPC